MKFWIRTTLIAIVALVVLGIGGFVIWAETPLGPMDEAMSALQSTDTVKVTTDRWLVFEPTSQQATTGFIFYPGGRVDERSYAPEAHQIAEQGYLVVIVPMPLHLAITAPGKAADVISAFPQITHWAIGGHSLGGVMAANYAHSAPGQIAGVVLWAAYPQESDSLASTSVKAAAIFGSNDGLVDASERQKAVDFLPPAMQMTVIEGGNHGQFGYYGEQPGDRPAAISRDEQTRQVVAATVALLGQLGR